MMRRDAQLSYEPGSVQRTSDSEHLLRFEWNFISGILETTSALIVVLDTQGRVLRLNRAIEMLTGSTILEAVGANFCELFLVAEEGQRFFDLFAELQPAQFPFEFQSRLRTKNEAEYHVLWSSTAILNDDGTLDFIIVTGIDITALKRAEREKEKLILDLQAALTKVKTLKGLLPICANCKKIRDDHGYWQRVEEYIRDHSDAEFSHGICPECAKRLYPQYSKDWYPGDGKM
jgi:PAS domain S-box-containing protein